MSRPARMLSLSIVVLVLVALSIAGCGATASGEELVNAECAGCHSLDIITNSANATQAEWDASVRRMEDKGMDITDAERTAIVDYLVAQSAAQ